MGAAHPADRRAAARSARRGRTGRDLLGARRRALYSSRGPDDYETLRRERHEAYEFLPADQEVWGRVLEVQRELARRAMTRAVGISDLIVAAVAAVAERHRVVVLHHDADFEHVDEITGQPVEWVVALGKAR